MKHAIHGGRQILPRCHWNTLYGVDNTLLELDAGTALIRLEATITARWYRSGALTLQLLLNDTHAINLVSQFFPSKWTRSHWRRRLKELRACRLHGRPGTFLSVGQVGAFIMNGSILLAIPESESYVTVRSYSSLDGLVMVDSFTLEVSHVAP